MSKKKKKESKPTSSYKIGDRTVAQTYWNGNDYVTKYNPTSQESQSMDYLQQAMPIAFADATNNVNREDYKNNWINNQTKQLNELADENLTALKDNLITGGQVGTSTGWNKIGKFTDSYADALNDINANADTEALNYQNNLLQYAKNIQAAMNGFYDLDSSLSQMTANNQNSAAGQNLQYANYNNSSSGNGLFGGLSAAGSLLGGIGTLASGWGSLSKKTGGNI